MTDGKLPIAVMSNNKNKTERADDYLDRILREAVEAGADVVELEHVPEGLEICFLAGGTGIGTVLMHEACGARGATRPTSRFMDRLARSGLKNTTASASPVSGSNSASRASADWKREMAEWKTADDSQSSIFHFPLLLRRTLSNGCERSL